jgi:hypothetical protein
MKGLFLATALAAIAVGASPVMAATFSGDYTASFNTSDPGLVLASKAVATTYTLNLANVGDSQTVDLFDLYTTETTVNPKDDTAALPISVDFNITNPSSGSGDVNGSTDGVRQLFGVVQYGAVTWSGPAEITLSNGDALSVSLNDATFDAGLFGLHGGARDGAVISADFTLEKVASAVPEPATWAMLLAGVAMMGGAIRLGRKRGISPALA